MSHTLPAVAEAPARRPGGPRRWRAADKAASLAAFATCGRSIKAFCAETGVPRATFTLWQREARAPRATSAARAQRTFARVELAPPPPTLPGITLTVRTPAGLEAAVSGLAAATLVSLLQVVLRAGAR